MKNKYSLSAVGILLLTVGSLFAQEKGGTLATLEFQKVKHQSVPQYEAGRKQKAAWHKQQNDPLPLLVWEVLSGEDTGSFVVGRFGQHWADLDKPAVSDEADVAEFEKVMGAYVDSVVTRYYNYMAKVSNPPAGNDIAKFSEIIVFYVRNGKESDFRSGISRVYEAGIRTKWPANYYWYELANGCEGDVFVLSLPHNSWADFEDKPEVKPYRDMVKDAFGQAEADSIQERFDHAIERSTSAIVKFRGDLSYLPGK